jgi:hypothetical protein
MSGFNRSNRSFSSPPDPTNSSTTVSGLNSHNRKGGRDSITGALNLYNSPKSPSRKVSRSLGSPDVPVGSSPNPGSRGGRKKKQALFGESYDPLALAKADKKVIPKKDASREVRTPRGPSSAHPPVPPHPPPFPPSSPLVPPSSPTR